MTLNNVQYLMRIGCFIAVLEGSSIRADCKVYLALNVKDVWMAMLASLKF